ncbi:lytic murein transglycosylase [Sediminimonas sp.]|uniref:lytic murein transglycosylase n=1 Tax=Sediminimonas sp. TaxID=2823379 RepID=UPI0025CEDECD|nr:lytic murein transglycosylase [Sediminimonas sp.]
MIPTVLAVFIATAAGAGPVEQSLRPEARPTVADVTDVIAANSAVALSLRPASRPPTLATSSRASPVQADFARWLAGFRARARAQGIRDDVLARAFSDVRYNDEVIAKDRNQSEFTKQIWDYLDSAASPVRVRNGKAALRRHARTLRAIEQHYGVDREVVVAIWGLESTYGERRGQRDVVESLATLAHDGRRGAFFEKQLIAALKILQSGDVAPRDMTGSWAGAMGHTQFIPTSYEAYAVDFDGDGRRDIWSDDPTDALASTAAYLARFGWTKGQPWGVEVQLPRGFKHSLARRDVKRMPSEWAATGVRGIDGRPVPDHGRASILLPAGAEGAAFMIFDNFKVIERYNKADAYVIGVGHLADRIAGGPPIQASWPRGYKPLSFAQRKDMQRRLRRNGFDVEKIDGIIGPNTVSAIRAFQVSRGITPDGYASETLMRTLRGR